MPARPSLVPKYYLHKSSGKAYTPVHGKFVIG